MRFVIIGILTLMLAAAASASAEDLSYDEMMVRAVQGDTYYQKSIGIFHELSGDLEEAAHWYKTASIMNNARAQLLLANAYQHGRGVPQSPMIGAAWYMLATINCERTEASDEALNGPSPSEHEVAVAADIALLFRSLINAAGSSPDCTEYDDDR